MWTFNRFFPFPHPQYLQMIWKFVICHTSRWRKTYTYRYVEACISICHLVFLPRIEYIISDEFLVCYNIEFVFDVHMTIQLKLKRFIHYSDVIMDAMASHITSFTIVYQPSIQAQIKENIKAPRHRPLCGEFTGQRWIPAQLASNVSIWWRHHVWVEYQFDHFTTW